MRGRIFASSNALLELTLPAHNAALAGDELTTIQLNHEWREIVASALQFYWRYGKSSLALDNEDMLDDLLEDLYTAELLGMAATRILNVDTGANQSITTTTYQPVGGSGFSHTFTKRNAEIECANIDLVNSASGVQVSVRPDIETLTADSFTELINSGTTSRYGKCSAIYSNLVTGTPRIIRLLGKRPSGTGTMNRFPNLMWTVREWD